ncbi:ABC transporter permease [Fulvivirgaceae bacterium PWU5]|uniref:ABC transporter permease n=1 Tax=Dawidia cretensis TaxID=2782350 RepID=A0AAP2DY12_9BACT|nr:ABC transporter permease [Dawidia cretensis]MBT1709476.1 ABC transporter permease [Dawidia cretensis]
MLKNYFKTAFRNLLRDAGISLINLSGLTLGITCGLILFLMVSYMNSFDTDQPRRDRIYRVVSQSVGNEGQDFSQGVPPALPDAFRTDFPEAEEVVFISNRSDAMITIPQENGEAKKFQEEKGIMYTEPGYFKLFARHVVEGDPIKGLDEPNEAVIAASWARKYFGREDVIGEEISFNKETYKISAVVDEAPAATDFPFNVFLSYSTIKKHTEEPGWRNTWSEQQCYVLLKDQQQAASIDKRLPDFSLKYLGKDDPDKTQFFLQALPEMHFDKRFGTYSNSTVSRATLTTLSVIGIILIITGCINFINLSTAEAIKRSKEVGVRKSLGSTRAQLIGQFLGETSMVTILAVILSLVITQIALGYVNIFLDISLKLDMTAGYMWMYLLTVTVVVSVCSGLYPAFVVSGYSPAFALKNLVGNKNSSSFALRRTLVVVQFCISQLFIIGTIIIIRQMDFYQKKDLGFVHDAIINVPIPESEDAGKGFSKMRTLRDELARVPGVVLASLASAPPSSGNVQGTSLKMDGADKNFEIELKQIDGNYIDLYKLTLLGGQNIQDADTARGFIVNEKTARLAGFNNPTDMVGTDIKVWGRKLPVVGVVDNFHTQSLHETMGATVMFNNIEGYTDLALKVDMARSREILETLKTKWESAYPEHIYYYKFLDEDIREFYEEEQKMSVMLSIFTSMAIFIGCLGLFGLATFMANQKTKEIGIRKVLGASAESIVLMFSKEYVRLIIIGFVLAAPVAWVVMNQFLSEYAYKIDIGADIFVLSIGITLLIALVTVGYRSVRAATTNPVNSLRSE